VMRSDTKKRKTVVHNGRKKKRGKNQPVENKEGFSSEKHRFVILRHGIHADDAIRLDGIGDEEVVDAILDAEKAVENGDVQVLDFVSLVPSLMRLDSSNVRIVGEDVGIDGVSLLSSIGNIGEGMMSQEVLMQPSVERSSIDKIVGGSHQSP